MKKSPSRIIWGVAALILLACLVIPASAVPVLGVPAGVTSGNATFPVANCVGSTFVWYGQVSGSPSWKSDNATPTGGAVSITIWGSPILGATTYYAVACDSTGCSNEVTFSTLAITPIPTRNYDAGFNAMAASHFTPVLFGSWVVLAYTQNIPATIFFGIILGFTVLGFWRSTKSVRLVGILFMILSPLLLTKQAGLYMGMPTVMQSLGAVLFAAGLAGVLLSFVKKT